MSGVLSRAVRDRRSCGAFAFALGLAVAAGQAPLGWWVLSIAALMLMPGLLWLVQSWRVAAWRGWFLGLGHFSGALFWIVEPFLVDIGRHGWMAPFALVLLAGGLALFWAAAFGLAARLGRGPVRRIAWLILTLSGAEILRSVLFTGFPWALIGHVWIGTPLMQAAAVFGAHGLTLWTLVAAALPVLLGGGRGAVAAIAMMALPAGYGLWRLPAAPVAPASPPVTVRLVQPNAAQHLKWAPEMIPVFHERLLDLTAAPPAPGAPRPDLVIWPETAIPWLLEDAAGVLAEIAGAGQGARVILGLQRRDGAGAWFNTLAVTDPDGGVQALYDKHHLVPFGEYMPLMALFARAGIFGLATGETGGYAAGSGPQVLDLGTAGRVLPLICYEAIFANDIARAPGRADWMVQITNDAWFGQLAGPWQHLALARLRAVEQGLPLMRAANTGISAAIDPYGRVIAALPLGESGFLDAGLPAPLPPTFYARYGDWPVFALLLLAGLFLARRPQAA